MDRKLVIEQIVKEYRSFGPADKEQLVLESLKRMGDLNLLAFATELGIDLTVVRS